MYKIVIAEDEERLRKGLCKFINWGSLGFKVSDSFEDGRELIEYLSSNNVDVVLTDIKMTEVSGLEVAKYVHENTPNTRVVVISGFKEFELAKKAIEYNVEHYLIKPADIDEICRVFTELKKKLDTEQEKRNTMQRNRERVDELIPILKEQFFVDIAMGAISTKQEVERRARLIGFDMDPSKTYCGIISIDINGYEEYIKDKWEYGREQLNMALHNILQENSEDVLYSIVSNQFNHIKMLSIALKLDTLEHFEHIVKSHMGEVAVNIDSFFDLTVLINFEGFCSNLFDLSNIYQTTSVKESDTSTGFNTIFIEQFKLLLSKINLGDVEATKKSFERFIRETGQLSYSQQKELIFSVITILSEKYSELGNDFIKMASNKLMLAEGHPFKNSEQLKNNSMEILTDIFNGVSASTEKSSTLIIKRAKEYIDSNYNRDISLNDVAEQVFLNPVYFSRFFKQQTGENFIDYIIKVRMNKAIDLIIENRQRVYEISKMVGYKSDKYFARLFKQYTGHSPKDYLRSVMKVSEPNDGK